MRPSSPATPPGESPALAGSAARGAVRGSERSLAPDLARGAVLLFIALANVSTYFYGRDLEPGLRPVSGSLLDDGLDFLVTVFVDRRSYPMFALLFGYGMVQLIRRQFATGTAWPAVRRVLLRRQMGLLLSGAVHTFLLEDAKVTAPGSSSSAHLRGSFGWLTARMMASRASVGPSGSSWPRATSSAAW